MYEEASRHVKIEGNGFYLTIIFNYTFKNIPVDRKEPILKDKIIPKLMKELVSKALDIDENDIIISYKEIGYPHVQVSDFPKPLHNWLAFSALITFKNV